MRIIYLGTPQFAVPTLEALIKEPSFEVVACVCQPDRPKGRGKQVQAPPVKEVAIRENIKVLQPVKLAKDQEVLEAMKELKPDILVMVAFGQILKKNVLEMAPYGVVNLHGSLLPDLRGAAPINWALIRGYEQTGITTMKTDKGVDTGPMLLKETIDIDEDLDSIELGEKLSTIGADLVVKTLNGIVDGTVKAIEQDDSLATYAPLLEKEMGKIDWSKNPNEIHNLVRGLKPWPGTFTTYNDKVLKVIKTRLINEDDNEKEKPGTLFVDKKQIVVACGQNGSKRIELIEVQPPNKSKMSARNWANGIRLSSKELLV